MDLERIAMMRAEEQLDAGAHRIVRTNIGFNYVGRCKMCGEKWITTRNRSGVCRDCWHGMTHTARRALVLGPPQSSFPCAFHDCPRPVQAKGLCMGHYKQQKAGRPLSILRPYHRSILRPMPRAA